MHRPSFYNIAIALTVALGSLTYGYSISVLANVVNKPEFFVAMKLDPTGPGAAHATTIIAWWNCIIYVGGFIFCLITPYFGNRYGRKNAITVGAVFSIIGGALQAGSVNAEMLIGARLIVGIGMGFLLPAVPLYQAEIAPPANRGLIVGFHASFIGFGTMVASWIGVAFYHIEGEVGWRTPLALQLVFPLALLAALIFVPESPRWLCMHDRYDEAAQSIEKLHSSKKDPEHAFARKELEIIKAQLAHEAQHRLTLDQALKKRSMQKRFALGVLAMSATQASGLIVVLTYIVVIFGALGYSGFMISIFTGIWCFFNGAGNLLGGIIGDYMGRKKQIFIGLIILDTVLILLCVTTRLYSGTENQSGKIAAAVLTFLLICAYTTMVECACFVYTCELFPGEWRALGISVSISAVFWWSIFFTAAASPAFANIGALYYLVFISMTTVMAVIVAFVFPDTWNYTLEQMAAVFGDDVIDMDGNVEAGKDFVREEHAGTELVEDTATNTHATSTIVAKHE